MTRGGTRTSRGARLLTLSRYAGVPVYSREVEGQGEGLPRAPRRAFTRRPSPLPLPAYRERGKCTARRFLLALVIVVVVGSMQSRALAHAGPHPHDGDHGASSAGPANFHQLLRTWAF